MRRLASVVLAVSALSVSGCSCTPKDGALRVEVTVVGVKTGCLAITAADADGADAPATTTVSLDPSAPGRAYTFGIQRKPGWSHSVKVDVELHEDNCSRPVIARAGDARIDVPSEEVVTRSYTLTVSDPDGDGFIAKASGGTDCDDANGAVHPGATEQCGNLVDDDCNGSADCFDAACSGQSCDDGNGCTTGDVCNNGCAGTPIVCNQSPGVCFQSTGTCGGDAGCAYAMLAPGTSCGAAMVCSSSGTCVAQDTEFDCTDGVSNDSDSLVDCADPDCLAQTCDAGLCISGETCQANGTCGGGGPVVCAAPANGCLDAGVCNPTNGACVYAPVAAGAACTDANACSVNDQCNGAGACVGTPMQCNTPGACELTGACDAGACVYPPATGQACDDSQMCTFTDVCSSAKVCGGTSYTCATPPECRMGGAAACLGDGGCNYVGDPSKNGTTCDGGTCQNGNCLSQPPFTASKFNPGQTPASGNVVINCSLTFDSTDGGVTGTWCGGPLPAAYGITQLSSNEPAVVLAMNTLTFTDAGVLRLVGNRAVILAIAGSGRTTIDGTIDAHARFTAAGAGGDRTSCGTQRGQDGGTDFGTVRGSGGGGGGNRTAGALGGTCITCGAGGAGVAGPTTLTPLVGGCRGGSGGQASATQPGGTYGAGGGAVQITTPGTLVLSSTARVTVSGGGGAGGPNTFRSGGGGGGSAGGILFEARYLSIQTGAAITANGGAGGEGSDTDQPGTNGANGSDTSATPAPGGNGGADFGGYGGNGAAGTTAPTAGENFNVGGGGGGAAGRIVFRAVNDGGCDYDGGALVSPPSQGLGTCN